MDVPVLETTRLHLRGHRLSDFEASAQMWADPAVTKYIGGRPSTKQESWTRLLRYVGHWALLGYGYWAITEKDGGRYLGEAGFADFRREMDPPLNGTPEAGWALCSWAHGQGFATEALQAISEWGMANLPSARTVCLITPENEPSLRLARRFGYSQYAESMLAGARTLLFERVAPARGG